MSAGGTVPGALSAFVDELAFAGVRDAVVCPGSRSTPLALALRGHSGIRVRVLIDERSAGFFALGIAKTTRHAVVLLATSGTAVVNFAPAVVEASMARVPLVVLTADRPQELLDRGAPQAIDQDRLYGTYAKWFAQLSLGDAAPDTIAHARSVAARAVATALQGPAGPVQINLPLRDPLIPGEDLRVDATSPAMRPFAAVVAGRRHLNAQQVESLAARIAPSRRGLIVAGPLDDPTSHEPITRLAAATGYPILADPLSGLRSGTHDLSMVLVHGDHIARPGPWIDAHHPEIVIRFGAMPTSKPLVELMSTAEPELLVFDVDGGWRESALIPATFIHADASAAALVADALIAAALESGGGPPTRGAWTTDWLQAEAAADHALNSWMEALAEPFEAAPFPALAKALPADAILWSGNSMPVRDMDAWLPKGERPLRVLCNRGANGIDGVVSTALGSAAAAEGPVALVVGDVSFLHDIGALVTARLHPVNLLTVLINNDGGGIFSFLPQARTTAPQVGLPQHYEELFGTPHGIDPGPIVTALGFRHRLAGAGDLETAIAEELGRPGVSVVEIRTDRARNAQLHAEAATAVTQALTGLLEAAP